MFTFTLAERDLRWKKVRQAMEKRGLECLILWSIFGRHGSLTANIRYLSNVLAEGYLVFPLEGEPTLFRFFVGHEPDSWVADNRVGHPPYSKAISERLRELHLESAKIGIVDESAYCNEMGFPYTPYLALTNNFPRASFENATDILEEARMIKSDEEIRCCELGCAIGEKVIEAIQDTAKIGVKEYEVRSVIMDTLFRNGCEPNSMLLYWQGKDLMHAGQGGWLTPARQIALEPGDVILAEFDAKYFGYFMQFNQPFSMGEPDKEWQQIFNVALNSFNNGLKTLRPGITAGELDEALLSPIREAGYKYITCAFHGLGLGGLEVPLGSFPAQPDYKPNTSFRIEAGMVIEFEPQAVTSDVKKGIHIGCPVVVTETGCRLLTRNWKPEFIAI